MSAEPVNPHQVCTRTHGLIPQEDWREHCTDCNEDWPCLAERRRRFTEEKEGAS